MTFQVEADFYTTRSIFVGRLFKRIAAANPDDALSKARQELDEIVTGNEDKNSYYRIRSVRSNIKVG